MALRRARKDDEATWTTLPSEGRSGRTPAWPLLGRPSRSQLALWRRLWKTPQAVQWERDKMQDRVARYVCKQLESDEPDAPSARATVAIRMADDLGLTYAGMNRLRWRVAADQIALKRAAKREQTQPRTTARSRLKVVQRADGA